MAITSTGYGLNHGNAFAGMVADDQVSNIVTKTNITATTVPYGKGVVRDTTNNTETGIGTIAAATTTAAMFVGVAVRELNRAYNTGDTLQGDARTFKTNYVNPFPLPRQVGRKRDEFMAERVKRIMEEKRQGRSTTALEAEIDVLVCATGFETVQLLSSVTVTGSGGRTLREAWAHGPEVYHGVIVAGFPNLFLLLGPNTGLGHNSVVYMAEAQADYVAAALGHMRRHGLQTLDVKASAEERWNKDIARRMRGTVWLEGGCQSWYLG